MKKRQIHGGELFGIILLLCIAAEFINGLWVKSDNLRIHLLWSNEWISRLSICTGAVVLVIGCVAGYISHEAFNKAVSTNGDVRYVLKGGLFKLVRHPFYFSLILITSSLFLFLRSYILLAGLVIVTIILARDARKEEKHLLEIFGDEYLSYQQRTGMFLPKVFRR